MKILRFHGLLTVVLALPAYGQQAVAPVMPAGSSAASLSEVKRIYVGDLVGSEADALKELIIASLDSTKLFTLTDNPDRADAVLKGAADDHGFVDTFDREEGLSTRQNGGKSGSGSSASRTGGAYAGLSLSDNQSVHTRERKHEAYASVRLCNKDGDVLWSTTQESVGAKFRGASADVATKIARQLTLDVEKARRSRLQSRNAGPSASQGSGTLVAGSVAR